MLKIKYNYHTHTSRCGHATGSDEEYVLAAIDAGILELGFTDHIFYKNLKQKGIRADFAQFDEYLTSIRSLKEKYKDQIKIFVGYEAEYMEGFEDFYREILESGKIDYLICGNHCYYKDKFIWYNENKFDKEAVKYYFDRLTKAVESGLFKYIAHPDMVLNSYPIEDDFIINQIRQFCIKSKENNVPLEINLLGAKRKEILAMQNSSSTYYPHNLFWRIASEIGCDVIIGIDAHAPIQLLEKNYPFAEDIIQTYPLKIIEKLNI